MMQQERLEPYVLRMIESDPSLKKLADRLQSRGGSRDTVEQYVKNVNRFAQWMRLSPTAILQRKHRSYSSILNDYITHLSMTGRSSNSISSSLASIKKWLIANEAARKADLEDVESPRVSRVSEDRLPTRAELKRLLAAADLMDKVLALVAISSGLRERAIMCLRLDQIDGIELKDGEVRQTRPIPRVLVLAEQSKNAKPYMSFLSPECAESIVLYLRERQMRGEVLTPTSSLIVSVQFRQPMEGRSAARRWRAMLQRAGLDQKNERGLNKINYLRFHNLRKFFKSWGALSGVSSDVVEFWMGHKAGIGAVYFVPGVNKLPDEILERLEGEYKKMLPAITVMSEGFETAKLEARIEQKVAELASKEALIDQLTTRLDAIELQLRKRRSP